MAMSLLGYSPGTMHDEFICFPKPTNKYPAAFLFPENFKQLRSAKFQFLRNEKLAQISHTNFDSWYSENGATLEEFLHLWTDFVWIVMADSTDNPQLFQSFPHSFEWESSFDTRRHRSTCLLYETIMLWHYKALIHYHKALAFEQIEDSKLTSDEFLRRISFAQVEMTCAHSIWSVICRMFLYAWKTKSELFLPWECLTEGNEFFSTLAIMKLEFYELATTLEKGTHILDKLLVEELDVVSLTPLSFVGNSSLLCSHPRSKRITWLCQRLAFSSSRISHFLGVLKSSHQELGAFAVHENEKSKLTSEMISVQFSDYELVAVITYLRFVMSHFSTNHDPLPITDVVRVIHRLLGGLDSTRPLPLMAPSSQSDNAQIKYNLLYHRKTVQSLSKSNPSDGLFSRLKQKVLPLPRSFKMVRILIEESAHLFVTEAAISLPDFTSVSLIANEQDRQDRLDYTSKSMWDLFPINSPDADDENVVYDPWSKSGFLEQVLCKKWFEVFEEFFFIQKTK